MPVWTSWKCLSSLLNGIVLDFPSPWTQKQSHEKKCVGFRIISQPDKVILVCCPTLTRYESQGRWSAFLRTTFSEQSVTRRSIVIRRFIAIRKHIGQVFDTKPVRYMHVIIRYFVNNLSMISEGS
jgi:hypothetical protein